MLQNEQIAHLKNHRQNDHPVARRDLPFGENDRANTATVKLRRAAVCCKRQPCDLTVSASTPARILQRPDRSSYIRCFCKGLRKPNIDCRSKMIHSYFSNDIDRNYYNLEGSQSVRISQILASRWCESTPIDALYQHLLASANWFRTDKAGFGCSCCFCELYRNLCRPASGSHPVVLITLAQQKEL